MNLLTNSEFAGSERNDVINAENVVNYYNILKKNVQRLATNV